MLERELRVVTEGDCIRVVGNVGDSPGPSDCHSELRGSDIPTGGRSCITIGSDPEETTPLSHPPFILEIRSRYSKFQYLASPGV